jgi:hypothetical protein
MATRTRSLPTTSGPFRTTGRVALVLGVVGLMIWGTLATVASGMGTVDETSVAFDVVAVGAPDPVNRPGIWDAQDSTGSVVWEGTEEEWQTIVEDGRAAYQADLRTTWLYPSAAIATVGLIIYMIGRRRPSEGTFSA